MRSIKFKQYVCSDCKYQGRNKIETDNVRCGVCRSRNLIIDVIELEI